MQRRLLVASVLSAAALTLYLFMGGSMGPSPAPSEQQAGTAEPGAEQAGAPKPFAAPAAQTATQSSVTAATAAAVSGDRKVGKAEQEIVIETETYKVTFSSRGGVVKSWILKNLVNAAKEPLDLVHSAGAAKYGYPFAVELPGGEALPQINQALFVVTKDMLGREVTFEYADQGWAASKSFRFEEQGYVFEADSELLKDGKPLSHLLTWSGGFGDTAQLQDALYSSTFYYDPAAKSVERNEASDAEEDRIADTGPYLYGGLNDLFFAAAFFPRESGQEIRLETSAIKIVATEGADEEIFPAVGVGQQERNQFRVFVGPKSVEVLSGVLSELSQIVDFGWFSPVAVPIFWMLRWTHDHVVSNYGWSIIFVTVFINFAMFPLKWKSMKSMKKMQELQPLVKQINAKYKGLSMKDPKKKEQNEEMMALYKKHGANPLGGCLPMILQLPFFIGFYTVLTVAIEMRHAEWLWVHDLSTYEHMTVRILPLAMMASQFWQQAMTPTPTADPSQAKLMKFMPLMMGFLFWGFSSGLVLFWLTGNLVGVLQQVIMNRFSPVTKVIEEPRRSKKKKKGQSRGR